MFQKNWLQEPCFAPQELLDNLGAEIDAAYEARSGAKNGLVGC